MNQLEELRTPTEDPNLVFANYNKLSENIRRLTPQGIQCSVFCGGANCKYENPENWKADSLAIQGIYSHWITDDILAMARPSTTIIIKKNIVQQFESLGIKSIINLQCAREHASCGHPLEESSGFTYDPNLFMENNIYYYNFAWKDYGEATLLGLLNVVKVLAFAITEGRVAVHCHAGLGRTGVLIACYLVYSLRVCANDAIRFVRLKRPGSVQTRGQILCIRHFAQYILPKCIIYYLKDNPTKNKYMSEFTLNRYLKRQKTILHGYEERLYKYIPKIINEICERILKLCGCSNTVRSPIGQDYLCLKLAKDGQNSNRHSICSNLSESLSNSELSNLSAGVSFDNISSISPNPLEVDQNESSQLDNSCSDLSTLNGDEIEQLIRQNKCFQELEIQRNFKIQSHSELVPIHTVSDVISTLLMDSRTTDCDTIKTIKELQNYLNNSQLGWSKLNLENNLNVLVIVLYEWLENLKIPILDKNELETIVIFYHKPELCFQKIDLENAFLIEYMIRFISKVQPIDKIDRIELIKRLIVALAQQKIIVRNLLTPEDKTFRKMGEGTLNCALQFFTSLLELVVNVRSNSGNSHASDSSFHSANSAQSSDEDDSDVECGFQ